MVDSCRECVNFEDRRNLEGITLCANRRGPYVSCPLFNSLAERLYNGTLEYGFCIDCVNFEEVDGKFICDNRNYPGIACEMFESRSSREE